MIKVVEECESKNMTVQSLQECLLSLEEDNTNIAREEDIVMQKFKKRKHKVHLEANLAQIVIELRKLEAK